MKHSTLTNPVEKQHEHRILNTAHLFMLQKEKEEDKRNSNRVNRDPFNLSATQMTMQIDLFCLSVCLFV